MALLIIIGMGYFLVFGNQVTIKATLGGEVCGVKEQGAEVKEGDPLVRVKSLTGNAVAARATANGKVIEVKVRQGDWIAPRTEVMIIDKR